MMMLNCLNNCLPIIQPLDCRFRGGCWLFRATIQFAAQGCSIDAEMGGCGMLVWFSSRLVSLDLECGIVSTSARDR